MRHAFRTLPLVLLLSVVGLAQGAAAPTKYLKATSHYFKAETIDLAALPEPPRPGTLAAAADLETILQLQGWRTEAQAAWALRVDQLDAFSAAEVIGAWFTRENLPKCALLLEEALGDGESLNYVAKLKYKRLRPPFQDPRVKPSLPLYKPSGPTPPAGYYSYPSGHATSIYLLAELLGELVPTRRDELQAWAAKAAWSRMLGGVHFPSDNLGGRILGRLAVKALKTNVAFLAALEGCKEELQVVQKN